MSTEHWPLLEGEPVEWSTRSLWAGARLWAGATTFFFAAFLFAYVYLRSLDVNRHWTIGSVHPAGVLGLTIAATSLLSAILWQLGARRTADTISTGIVAILLALLAIVLQFVEFTVLGFGGASGGYASVYIGWTVTWALGAICCVYWIETQVASYWRAHRGEVEERQELIMRAGIEASAFFWAYYVALGLVMYAVLYLA